MLKYIYIGLLVFINLSLMAQTSTLNNNKYISHVLDRLEVKYLIADEFHSSIKHHKINEILDLVKFVRDSVDGVSEKDLKDIEFILQDNIDWLYYTGSITEKEKYQYLNSNRKPILKYFYKSESSFLTGKHENFFIKFDPVINFKFGKDINSGLYNFQNTRGFAVSGLLDKKIYFYSSLYETQQSFLSHINNRINKDLAIPGQGLYKKYSSSIFENVEGYDFLNAQAYLGFKLSKSINAEIGHSRFFIGEGIRSLLLSDFSHNYYYLKFDTKVWKFHYQNIFAEMSTTSSEQIGTEKILPKKYMALHYLSFKPNRNLEIGLFESVIFQRKNQFELQYLNPLIIFRTVEQFIGSPDNVLIGLNWKYNFLKKFSLYGQFLLDEFNFAKLSKDRSWWANKYGLQLGIKYIDVFKISHFDMQIETNIVRPYTYSHRDSETSFSHFNQPLAHPLGANFKEFIIKLRYSPSYRFNIDAKILYALQGVDIDEISYGGDILKSSTNRPINDNGNIQEFGFYIGNGINRKISQYSVNLSYMFLHNYYLDFNVIYRIEDIDLYDKSFDEFYIGGGVRVNIVNREIDY